MIKETVNARKAPIAGRDALALLEGVHHLYATRGRAVTHIDLRHDAPTPAELRALMVGPTGNLRAPTLRRGRTLLVGFDAAAWAEVLGV